MDTDTAALSRSDLDSLVPGFDDPDPTDVDRLAASLDFLTLYCRKPRPDEPGQHAPGWS